MTGTPVAIPESAKRPFQPGDAGVLRALAAAVAVAAAGGCIAAAVLQSQQFFFRYLVGVLFLVSLGAGSLFWLLLHYLTGASWSCVTRRLIEHAAAILVPAGLLFIPILFGLNHLFSWTADEVDAAIAAKQVYLNRPFFIARAAGYFAVWVGLTIAYRRTSLRQDVDIRQAGLTGLRKFSPPALILLAFTATFAAFDWIMSLDPHWVSNIMGVYFWAGSLCGSLAFITLLTLWARRRPGLDQVIRVEHLHDLGKLQFGFVSFWAYIAFSQYLLIWYANIPEETAWYVERSHGGWGQAGLVLAFGHFVAPFLVLLPRRAKRSSWVLAGVSVWLLAFHALDLVWQILPTLGSQAYLIHWIDPLIWLLVVAVTVWTIVTAAAHHALAPIGDPQLPESIAFENE